ncbi:hypothetical protein [Compostibacter hankyongensis]|uniref:Uncharacterized protein n=1 Tax=Compostibacter hankyongensis TaxID=1007089 RepID=A0ABP8FWY6_9BACT
MSQQTLIYILLALILLSFVYGYVRDWLAQRKGKAGQPPVSAAAQDPLRITLPLQLQAYERLVVWVERVSPEQLIGRLNQPGLDTATMQQLLIQTIRAEFEHNISQQIYVSAAAWEAVCTVKEQLISLINRVAAQLPPAEPALTLNKKLLELVLQSQAPFPTRTALGVLNAEAKKLMKG